MPNRSSHAHHVPLRTCVICKRKAQKQNLFRFILLDGKAVFDLKQKIMRRGYYVCDENECLQKLDKWISRKKKHRKKNDK